MPNGDHRDGFFYRTLTLMIDSYMLQVNRIKLERNVVHIHLSYPHTHDRFLILTYLRQCDRISAGTWEVDTLHVAE